MTCSRRYARAANPEPNPNPKPNPNPNPNPSPCPNPNPNPNPNPHQVRAGGDSRLLGGVRGLRLFIRLLHRAAAEPEAFAARVEQLSEQ